jgi:hypothetical protein
MVEDLKKQGMKAQKKGRPYQTPGYPVDKMT